MDEVTARDQNHMRAAIAAAKKGLGFVAPNPPVGCVIVAKSGEVLATGYHQKVGGPHAEIEALNKVADKNTLNGATVYVTLEPCAHHGRTPPCADRLAELPISRVVYGLIDPNPKVSGRGARLISDKGITVDKVVGLNSELDELVDAFVLNQKAETAFVTLKLASSLDGQVALKNGESMWITSESSRQHARRLRGQHDAVIIGAGTLVHDNPRLDLRDTPFEGKKDVHVVVLDPKGVVDLDAQKFKISEIHKPENISIIRPETPGDEINLKGLKKCLFKQGISQILVEGGAYVHSLFLRQREFDKVFIYLAPKIIGHANGLSWSSEFSISNLKSALRLESIKAEALDPDILISGYLSR